MPNIRASFRNNYGESRRWLIWDIARDPNSPPVIFDGYLEPDQSTDWLTLYSSDGIYGRVTYQRSDGAPTTPMDISDGDTVNMN